MLRSPETRGLIELARPFGEPPSESGVAGPVVVERPSRLRPLPSSPALRPAHDDVLLAHSAGRLHLERTEEGPAACGSLPGSSWRLSTRPLLAAALFSRLHLLAPACSYAFSAPPFAVRRQRDEALAHQAIDSRDCKVNPSRASRPAAPVLHESSDIRSLPPDSLQHTLLSHVDDPGRAATRAGLHHVACTAPSPSLCAAQPSRDAHRWVLPRLGWPDNPAAQARAERLPSDSAGDA